jgi:hypothetical protein
MVAAPPGRIAMNRVLDKLRSRLAGWMALRSVLASAAMMGALTLAAVLADAAVDLPEAVRVAAPIALGAAVFGVLLAGIVSWRRLTEMVLARALERKDPALGNRLSNAVDLSYRTGDSPVQEFLRREAVEQGRRSAAEVPARQFMGRSVPRVLLALVCSLLGWGTLFLAAPDLVRAVLPRFLDARGDHPPFSRLILSVNPGPASVLYGGQMEVRATVGGRLADKLWLVQRTGKRETRAIMFLAPDKSFFQTLANLREATEYWVTDGTARSRRFPVAILTTPQIVDVEVMMEFPEYTGKPAHSGKLSGEAQALPEGARARFRVTSNRPLKSGAIELTPVLGGAATAVELAPEITNGPVVSGGFALTEAVAFSLSVRDTDGLASAEKRRGRFNILPDRPPRIFVLEPGRDAVATPTTRVPVRVQATDDYAVSRVGWLRGLNRSTERPLNMKLTLQSGPQSVGAAGVFDLAKLGVQPGDVIDYYFEAADNYPKGPNVVFSRPFRLEIISQEQYETILRREAAKKTLFESYFKNDAWLKRLAEQARSAAAKAQKAGPGARDDAAALAGQLQEYEKALQRLLQDPALFDVEQSFRETLAGELAAIEAAKSTLAQVLAGGVLDPETMKKLSEDLGALSNEEVAAVFLPAEEMAAVIDLAAAADSFVKLAQRQAALAQMLERFAGLPNALTRMEQMELQELAHQQQRVRDDLSQLLGKLPGLEAKVPRQPAYEQLHQDVNDFLQAAGDLNIYEDLAGAAKALEEPDPFAGHALALHAAQKMDRLIARCNSAVPDAGQGLVLRFAPVLAKPGLGGTFAQILAALGVGPGQGGRDGYGLFNEDAALYGPNIPLAGDQAGGRSDLRADAVLRDQQVAGDARDAGWARPEGPGRVRLLPDAKFPLRYRDLVGEYFRAVAE